jgi:hypothetical protein
MVQNQNIQFVILVFLQLTQLLQLSHPSGTCGCEAVYTSGTYIAAAPPFSPDVSDHFTVQLALTNQTCLPVEGRKFILFQFLFNF